MSSTSTETAPAPSAAHGRLCVVLAALLWSTSGAFTKVLRQETALGLHEPQVHELLIAFYRALFAGLVLVPFVRRQDVSCRWPMLPMMACFAVMNATFVSALALGTAANAIVLQYTAPMWMYLGCVWLLHEPGDRRSLLALGVGLVGIVIIVQGGWGSDQLPAVQLGLISGVMYAGVMIGLRVLNTASSRWLTVINQLASALVLLPWILPMLQPTGAQLALLFVFGTVQMAVPYWLVARGVRSISPQEAGTITLLEPLLNPLWAYLVSKEMPMEYTYLGGAFILGGLMWRYWPRKAG
jgi:drug/metabolite transporter (DMT)-like permease